MSGELEDAGTPGLSRRRILIGTAWATPAIVLAVSVPQAAASTIDFGGVLAIDNFNSSDGTNGNAHYNLGFRTQWGANYPQDISTITFTYIVDIYSDAAHTALVKSFPAQTVVKTAANPLSVDGLSYVITGVTPGDYYGVVTVTAEAIGSGGDTYHASAPPFDDTAAPLTVT